MTDNDIKKDIEKTPKPGSAIQEENDSQGYNDILNQLQRNKISVTSAPTTGTPRDSVSQFEIVRSSDSKVKGIAYHDGTEWVFINSNTSRQEVKTTTPNTVVAGNVLAYHPAYTSSDTILGVDYEAQQNLTDGIFIGRVVGTFAVKEAISVKFPFNVSGFTYTQKIAKAGSPGDNFRVSIASDLSGVPGGNIESISKSISNTTLTSESFVFTANLTANTKYWIILERTGAADNTNYYICEGSLGSNVTVPGIFTQKTFNSSGGWSDGSAIYDFNITPAATTSGWYVQNLIASYTSSISARLGVVESVSSGTATIVMSGICTLSGLTRGASYYANSSGILTTTPGILHVGIALSDTELLVSPSQQYNYSIDFIISANINGVKNYIFPLGFTPQRYSGYGAGDSGINGTLIVNNNSVVTSNTTSSINVPVYNTTMNATIEFQNNKIRFVSVTNTATSPVTGSWQGQLFLSN